MSKYKPLVVYILLSTILALTLVQVCKIVSSPFFTNTASSQSIDKSKDSYNILVFTNELFVININSDQTSKLAIPINTCVYHNGEYCAITDTGGIDNIIDHVKMLTGIKINYYIVAGENTFNKLKTYPIYKLYNENIYSNLSILNILKLKILAKQPAKTYTISGKIQKNGLFLVENNDLNTLRKLCYKHFLIF